MSKKIIVGLISALMALGLAIAAAPNLSTYPTFLGEDGQLNAIIVVGQDAKPEDVVAAADIAVGLGEVSTVEKTVTVSTAAATVTGGVSLDTSASRIYLNDAINSVKDTLTSSDLPTVLADGTFVDDEGDEYDYTQYILVGSNRVSFDQEDSDEDPVLEIAMSTSNSNPLYTLKVIFTKAVNFTDSDSIGNRLDLFGTTFTVGAETDSTDLVLYKAYTEVTLEKGESTTVTVGGTDYTIEVRGFDTANDAVVLTVNGDTDDVIEGNSKKIGGLEVFAKSVTAWEQGAAGIAVLQLGSEKITLRSGSKVMVGENEEEVDGTWVTFTGSPTSLSVIQIAVYAPDSDEDYIAAGSSFEDPFAGTFSVAFNGITSDLKAEDRDEIRFRVSGDYKGYVVLPDGTSLYFAYNDSLGDQNNNSIYVVENATAEEDEIIFLAPADPTYTHIVRVKDIRTDDEEGYVQFTDLVTGTTYTTLEGDFNDTGEKLNLIVDGKTYNVTLVNASTPSISVEYDADNKLVVWPALELNHGEYLAITAPTDVNLTGLDGYNLTLPTGEVSLTYVGNDNETWNLTYGATSELINLTTENSRNASLRVGRVTYWFNTTGENVTQISIAGKDDIAVMLIEEEDDADNANVVIVETEVSGDLGYEEPSFTATVSWEEGTSDDDVTAYLDYYGTYAERDTSTSGQAIVTIWYPDEQVYALVAVGESPEWTTTAAGTTTYKEFVPITTPISYLDTEVLDADGNLKAEYANKNIITVGGPAVNRLTAKALNLTYPSYGAASGIPEGKAIIQIVESPWADGKYIVVVAGWEAANTRAAAAALLQHATQLADIDSAKAIVEGSGATITSVTAA